MATHKIVKIQQIEESEKTKMGKKEKRKHSKRKLQLERREAITGTSTEAENTQIGYGFGPGVFHTQGRGPGHSKGRNYTVPTTFNSCGASVQNDSPPTTK